MNPPITFTQEEIDEMLKVALSMQDELINLNAESMGSLYWNGNEYVSHQQHIDANREAMRGYQYQDRYYDSVPPKIKECHHVWKKEYFFSSRAYETCTLCKKKKEEE